jgi:hypothetical protein
MHLSPRGNEMVTRTVASYLVEKMKAPVGSQ